MTNAIIDIFHGNEIDFQKVSDAGIIAIIHKATQGTGIKDKKYHARKEKAKAMGFLWGAYHFSTGESVTDQVENFLSFAVPGDDELISLDWEPSDGPDMTIDQARDFVQLIKKETGRFPVIYGGSLLREQVGHMEDEILKQCPLWYARYRSSPVGIPAQIWPTFTLWQYTDGNDGPEPQDTPGVGGADRNIFDGTADNLREEWPLTRRAQGIQHGQGFAGILAAKKSIAKKAVVKPKTTRSKTSVKKKKAK